MRLEALSALFDRLARRFTHILVDLPVSAYDWTVPLLSASQGIVVTGAEHHSRPVADRGHARRHTR